MRAGAARRFELLFALVAKEFKVRYKNTALGFLWSLANPVFFALVFFVAFKHILKVPTENYLGFLLAGLFPWQWFANTVQTSTSIFITNAPLIKKVYFPRMLLPMATAGNHLIHFCLALLVAIPVMALQGSYPSLLWIPGIPMLMVIQGAIILGMSFIFSSLNVFFRDLEHLTGILINLIFYLTPILYSEEVVPEKYRPLFWLNPMYSVIPSWRNLILHGTLDGSMVGIGAAHAAAVLLLGCLLFRSLEWRFAESI